MTGACYLWPHDEDRNVLDDADLLDKETTARALAINEAELDLLISRRLFPVGMRGIRGSQPRWPRRDVTSYLWLTSRIEGGLAEVRVKEPDAPESPIIEPPDEPEDGIEGEILDVMHRTLRRHTREEMAAALKHRSEHTVYKTLWRMRKNGLLSWDRDSSGNGFGLPEWG